MNLNVSSPFNADPSHRLQPKMPLKIRRKHSIKKTKTTQLIEYRRKGMHFECNRQAPIVWAKLNLNSIPKLLRNYKTTTIIFSGKLFKKTCRKNKKGRYACVKCQLTFKHYSKQRYHYFTKHTPTFRCKACSMTFKRSSHLRKHVVSRHKKHFSPQHRCRKCGQPFLHQRNLKIHCEGRPVTRRRSRTSHGKIRCEACKHTANSILGLKKHVLSKHPDISFPCGVLRCRFVACSTFELEGHIKKKHEQSRGVLCEICSKWFIKPSLLKKHMFTKHHIKLDNLKVYHCDIDNCKYECISQAGIDKHKSFVHSEATAACPHCQKKLKTQFTLQKHINKMHLNIRPYLCQVCGQSFGEEYDLRYHEQRHKIKEFKCHQCDYASTSQQDYCCHMYSAHKVIAGDKMKVFHCDKCAYSTVIKSRIKNHMESHNLTNNYICQQCGKFFKSERTLKKHFGYVHKPKSFPCTHCDHTSRSLNHLNEHIRIKHTHRDLKPYQCGHCEFRSATSGNCRKHVINRHKGCEVNYSRVEPLPKIHPARTTLSASDDIHDDATTSNVLVKPPTCDPQLSLSAGQYSHDQTHTVHNMNTFRPIPQYNVNVQQLQHGNIMNIPANPSDQHDMALYQRVGHSLPLQPIPTHPTAGHPIEGYLTPYTSTNTNTYSSNVNGQPYHPCTVTSDIDVQLGALVSTVMPNVINFASNV